MTRILELLDRARHATGLDDFGDDGFREGLEILVASAERQARLTPQGHAMFAGMLVDMLSHRLRIEHIYALHPEIDDQQIVAPLIGLGLPRTGSTALSCLLAADPAVRFLRTWESAAPCPPPDLASERTDPRIAAAEQRQLLMDRLFPRMKDMLPLSATAPTECQNFMAYDFKSQVFLPAARMPDYVDWLLNVADLVPTYRYVKRVLKLLQWRRPPNRWRLKNPSHTPFIGALAEVFPDARFWVTHRDVTRVIPSVVDLYLEMGRAYTDDVDLPFLVEENVAWCEAGLRRLIAFRDAGHDHLFFDVRFADIQRDPIGTVERLYAFLGEPLSGAARQAMAAWRQSSERGAREAGDYGAVAAVIDEAALRRRFAFYSDRYGVPPAHPPATQPAMEGSTHGD